MTRPFGWAGTASTPSRSVAAALDVLNGAAGQLRQLVNDHRQQVRAIGAEVARDPNLTAQGRQNALRERTGAVVDRVGGCARPAQEPGSRGAAGDHRRCCGCVAEAGRRRGGSARPAGRVAARPAAARRRHDRQRRYRRDGGYRDALRVAGGAADLGASVRRQTAKAAQIAQRVDAQMAKVAGGTSEVDLTAKFEAAALVAGLDPLLTGAEAEIAGRAAFGDGFGLNAAIASNLAMQAQRAYFQPITQPDGTVL